MSIIAALNADAQRDDPLFRAARLINDCKDLPDATKAALVQHIHDARAKHPYKTPSNEYDAQPSVIPDTRPGPFAKAAGKVAKATKKVSK